MRVVKVGFLLVWISIFLLLLTNAPLKGHLFEFLKAHPYLAPLVLVVLQAVLASLALPCSPLTVLAGLLWGVWIGLVYSLAATLVASVLTFLLGRFVLRRWLLEWMSSGWRRRIIVMIERFGWKASALAHANPVFPGSSLGYCFGASGISLAAFVFGMVVGNVPLQVLMVAAGDLTRNVAEGEITAGIVILALLIMIALLVYRIAAPRILDVSEQGPEGAGKSDHA